MDPSRSKLTYSLILIVGVLTVGPVVMLILGSFSEGLTAFGQFTLDKRHPWFLKHHRAHKTS